MKFEITEEMEKEGERLADLCEAYVPRAEDEVPLEEYLLKRAARERAWCDQQLAEAVSAARAKGSSWRTIGEIVGVSAQTARNRYGRLVEAS